MEVNSVMSMIFIGTHVNDMVDTIIETTGACGVRYENGKVVSLSWVDFELGCYFYAPINEYNYCEVVYSEPISEKE